VTARGVDTSRHEISHVRRAAICGILLFGAFAACGGKVDQVELQDAAGADVSSADAGPDAEDAGEAEAAGCGPGEHELPGGCYTCQEAGIIVGKGLGLAWEAARKCEPGDKCVLSQDVDIFCVLSCGEPVVENKVDALYASFQELNDSSFCVCPHGAPPVCLPGPKMECINGRCEFL